MKRNTLIIILILIALFLIGLGFYYFAKSNQINPSPYTPPSSNNQEGEQPKQETKKELLSPISDAKSRITKKPFGKYVTPQNSPVQPEKFTGYHTGVDFEAKENEQNTAVDILTICKGEILQKGVVQGYGGLIIQDCTIASEKTTVLYGHVDLLETVQVGQELNAGQKLTTLADPFSELSGDERKHLHLGIHKGTNIEYLGYISSTDRLNEWMNIEALF